MSENSWLKNYDKEIYQIKRQLNQFELMGSSDTKLDLGQVKKFFDGAIFEIKSLQSKVDVLQQEIAHLREPKKGGN